MNESAESSSATVNQTIVLPNMSSVKGLAKYEITLITDTLFDHYPGGHRHSGRSKKQGKAFSATFLVEYRVVFGHRMFIIFGLAVYSIFRL